MSLLPLKSRLRPNPQCLRCNFVLRGQSL